MNQVEITTGPLQSGTLPEEKALSAATQEARGRGSYRVVEIFYSLQGEGKRAGQPMVFIRFSDCNLRCTWKNAGFDCDTEFVSGREMTAKEILHEAHRLAPKAEWLLMTGGEPALQLDQPFIDAAHDDGWKVAVETNGTIPLSGDIDWVCVSPKSAEHTIRQTRAHEVKYVRHEGMGVPVPRCLAEFKLISPAFQADGSVRPEDLKWCQKLVLENPEWQLSIQAHKLYAVR